MQQHGRPERLDARLLDALRLDVPSRQVVPQDLDEAVLGRVELTGTAQVKQGRQDKLTLETPHPGKQDVRRFSEA